MKRPRLRPASRVSAQDARPKAHHAAGTSPRRGTRGRLGAGCEPPGCSASRRPFLRSLDTGALTPARSEGGHRRYACNQIERVVALRELAEQRHTLAGTAGSTNGPWRTSAPHFGVPAARNSAAAVFGAQSAMEMDSPSRCLEQGHSWLCERRGRRPGDSQRWLRAGAALGSPERGGRWIALPAVERLVRRHALEVVLEHLAQRFASSGSGAFEVGDGFVLPGRPGPSPAAASLDHREVALGGRR